jgi:hypothetical protein
MNPETHPIDYKAKFEHSALEKAKLTQAYDDGSKRQKYCPMFSGKHGLEELLFVEERFRKVANHMEWTGEELFEHFEEVLIDTAENQWEDIVGDIDDVDRDEEAFENAIKELYLKYCGGDARDVMFEYLKTQCRKPIGEEPRTHVARLTTLYRYSNKLPGIDPEKDTEHIKMPIFATFPESWRRDYARSGRKVANDSLQDIIDYMSMEKAFADQEGKDKKRKNEKEDKNDKKGNKKKKVGMRNGDNSCRLPGHSGHDWKDCFENPRGRNFRPRNNGGGRGGSGRGNFQGRGFYGGRNGGRGGQPQQGRGGRGPYQGQGQGNNQNNNGGQQYHYQNGDQNRNSNGGSEPVGGSNGNNAHARQQNAVSNDGYHSNRSQETRVHWW